MSTNNEQEWRGTMRRVGYSSALCKPSGPHRPFSARVPLMKLIAELKAIQGRPGYLTEEELRAFSQRTATPLYKLQAVASFYPHFRLHPSPRLDVKVCADLSCHLAGASRILATAKQQLAKQIGCEIGTTSCLGRCDQAPAVAVNDTIYAGVSDRRLETLLTAFHQGVIPDATFAQQGTTTYTIDPYSQPTERFSVLRELLSTGDVARIIQTLKDSGLRGMGGAGFPTGLKWEIVRNATGEQKYVVVNADESEPGTFKDRFLMEKFPHLLIEGILLGSYVVGAQKAYLFIRHE